MFFKKHRWLLLQVIPNLVSIYLNLNYQAFCVTHFSWEEFRYMRSNVNFSFIKIKQVFLIRAPALIFSANYCKKICSLCNWLIYIIKEVVAGPETCAIYWAIFHDYVLGLMNDYVVTHNCLEMCSARFLSVWRHELMSIYYCTKNRAYLLISFVTL